MQTKRTTVPAVCRQCGKDFAARKDGPGIYCSTPCVHAAKRMSPDQRAEAARATHRASYAKHREARLEYGRQKRAAPEAREEAAARTRRYYAEHREHLLAKLKAQNGATRDRRRAYQQANLERYAELAKAWRVKNPDRSISLGVKCRAIKHGLTEHFTGEEWGDLKARAGYRCLRCDRVEPEIKLTVDHIIPLSKGGVNTIDNIQPLCGPCNSKKQDTLIVDYRVAIMQKHG